MTAGFANILFYHNFQNNLKNVTKQHEIKEIWITVWRPSPVGSTFGQLKHTQVWPEEAVNILTVLTRAGYPCSFNNNGFYVRK